jgi:YebC/PmpR family DNA-binding regulatory protein
MSGHSKWNNIKRTKEKTDAQRGKVFTKLVREISVSVKESGADPATNNRLKDAISKARQNNMPSDSIQRAIKKSAGELGNVNYETINYEGYGTGGSAVMVSCLTDNRNRTASDVRHAFDKFGGSLGQTGSVSFLFERKGVFVLEKQGYNYDKLFDFVLENNGEDLEELEESFVLYCLPENYSSFLKACEQNNINLLNSEIEYVPLSDVTLDEQQLNSFEKMIAQLEDSDDVSSVYHNVNF